MTQVEILDAARDGAGGYKVDVSRGERIGRVSSEWFSRPADERYLSLSDLFAAVYGRTERSRTRTVESATIRVGASREDAERLTLVLPGSDAPVAPTHWSFGQLASLVGAPAAYLRQLPAPLVGINLQYGLTSHRAEQVKTLEIEDGRVELRAVTGPDYGRIFDHELVAAVQRIAGNGTGDTRWKVPGVLDWSTGIYNPRVDITKDTTTLYASDHILRHSFASVANDLGFTEVTIAALVGHAKGSVTSNYIHTLDTALIMAADTISGYIQGLLDGVEFKQTAYALDRGSRKAALARFLRRVAGDEDAEQDQSEHLAA
ncbi:hypothetical protein [Xanthobacter autotrophicus]|uniref:hypothetical protein n=1 Tax=Xanthobacter autotrophicus TaxID=280 RepID=UPI00372D316C